MKKLGLALGAGGARGFSHVGFLIALEEEGIKPDYITGCSMGSVVGGAYAAGVSTTTMKHIVSHLRLVDLITPAKSKGGLFGTKKMYELLQKFIGDKKIEELEIPFRCVAVDMIKQEVCEFKEGSLLDGIIASSSIPALFHPMEKDGKRLIDGGILERVPAHRLKEMGAEVIVAVDVLGDLSVSEEASGTFGTLLQTFDLMGNCNTRAYHEKYAKEIDFWLDPQLGNMSQYNLKDGKMALEKGYALGKTYAPLIKEKLKSGRIRLALKGLKKKEE